MGWEAAIYAALVSSAASMYTTHQTNAAQTAAAQAANAFDLGTFREANDFSRAEADKARWFNADQAQIARDFQAQQTGSAQQFNAAEAQKNRDYQTYMSNTQYQRAIGDMKSAGLNPMLAYSQGGAGGASGSAASVAAGSAPSASGSPSPGSASAPRGTFPTVGPALGVAVNSAIDSATKVAQLENVEKQGKLLEAQAGRVNAEIPLVREKEYEAKATNTKIYEMLEERLRQAKSDTNLKDVAQRTAIELEEINKQKVRENLDQEQTKARLLKLDERMTQYGIPKAKAESDFFSDTGAASKYIGLITDALGMGSSAASMGGKLNQWWKR